MHCGLGRKDLVSFKRPPRVVYADAPPHGRSQAARNCRERLRHAGLPAPAVCIAGHQRCGARGKPIPTGRIRQGAKRSQKASRRKLKKDSFCDPCKDPVRVLCQVVISLGMRENQGDSLGAQFPREANGANLRLTRQLEQKESPAVAQRHYLVFGEQLWYSLVYPDISAVHNTERDLCVSDGLVEARHRSADLRDAVAPVVAAELMGCSDCCGDPIRHQLATQVKRFRHRHGPVVQAGQAMAMDIHALTPARAGGFGTGWMSRCHLSEHCALC